MTISNTPSVFACRFSRITKALSLLSVVAAVSCVVSPVARAATVFEFGSNTYVSDNVNFERTATATNVAPYTSTVAFDNTNPLSPSEGYTGPTFYGGYTFQSDSFRVGFAHQRISNDFGSTEGNDPIFLNVISENSALHGTTMSFASVFVFKQESFKAPFQNGNVSVDGFSISLYKRRSPQPSTGFTPEGRWLVEMNGSYYLSDSSFSVIENDKYVTFELSGESLQSTLWATYDPESNLVFDLASANFQSLDLDAVTAVGFYFEDQSFQAETNTIAMRFAIGSFSVTSIPEPGTVAFLAAGIPLLLGYFLRR